MEKPYHLFKFRKINIIENNIAIIDQHLIDAIEHSEIYFARPKDFNDPFECQVDIINALENAISRSEPKIRQKLELLRRDTAFYRKTQNILPNLGICTFSGKGKSDLLHNPLMWAHYADGHRGLCLTYSFPRSFFYENKDQIIGIGIVDYKPDPLSNWFIKSIKRTNKFDIETIRKHLIQKMLTIKDMSWKYEKEVRIINDKIGAFPIDKQYLKQVCFGLKTKESDIEFVTELLRKHDYNVSRCRIIRDSKHDFGIIAKEI